MGGLNALRDEIGFRAVAANVNLFMQVAAWQSLGINTQRVHSPVPAVSELMA